MTGSDGGRASDGTTGADGEATDLSLLVFTSHRPEEVVEPLRETALDVAVVSVDGGGSLPSRTVAAVRRTRRALAAHDPDAVLLDCYEAMGALVTLLADRRGVPVVDRLVGDTWLRFENGIREAKREGEWGRAAGYRAILGVDEFVFSRASGFVVVSEQLGEVVRRRTGCPPGRIGNVPVPAPEVGGLASSNGGERFGIDADRVLLTVTNLKYRAKLRGVETALEELLPLLDADPGLAYVVAGGGEYASAVRATLDERVDDPDVRRRIHALGYVDGVADLYALADAFVYVSYLDGYPRVVLEAQEAGLPVVANDAFGMREQVDDGESGYLIDPAEPGALREAVSSLLAEPETRRRYGERGRDRVARENAPAVVGRQLEAFLRRLVAAVD
ncbi:glycosyltransferase family 4 protein [Halorubrum lipolyticum]|uniref:Group 1 glycosyl transferase n=1 Tax=Halorubrum lipolyticum DSM 21995 TaxID=1227482 RepID=M0NQJ6_9EURY|nr:glycosyltransferase family 4 protein [Halorubrum lipolyticum]EMA58920.1 group 1 glycosyl transferase [Halorubrum lipolyticum DSM 21995]